jgi:hypothetical protein
LERYRSSIELSELTVAVVNASLVSQGDITTLEGDQKSVELSTNTEAVHASDLLVDGPADDPERTESDLALNESHLFVKENIIINY